MNLEQRINDSTLERRAPYSLRLAMLFALTDKSLTIEKHHLEAALAWVRYCRDSVRFIFAEKAGIADAEELARIGKKILDFLQDKPNGESKTEIINTCFAKRISAGKIDKALQGMMTATPPRVELIEKPRTNGRPGNATKIYRLFSNDVRGTCGISGMRDGARDSAFAESADCGGLWKNGDDPNPTIRHVPQQSESPESQEQSHVPHNPHVPQTNLEKHDLAPDEADFVEEDV